MHTNRKDLGAAAVFAIIGAFFAIDTLRKLRIGSAMNMGPGYFPLVLAVVMLVLAALIAFQGLRSRGTEFGRWPWRGVILILGAPIIFSFSIRGMGLLPTTFLTALFTSFASTRMTPLTAIALSFGIAVFCCLVFIWGISMPVPWVGPWLSFARIF